MCVLIFFLDISWSDTDERNLKAILIFISFMAKGIENFFKYLLHICVSSHENFLLSLSVPLLNG